MRNELLGKAMRVHVQLELEANLFVLLMGF